MTADTGEYGTARGDRAPAEIIGGAPSGRPVPHLTVAVARAGGTGILGLGAERAPVLAALADVHRWWTGPFGVRVPLGCRIRAAEIPPAARTVVVEAPALHSDDWLAVAGFARGRRLLIEVADPAQAADALRIGRGLTEEVGIIARDGGRPGDPTAFVLLQMLLAEVDAPVYAASGIGPHTAAAAVAGGAAGVVLDEQLAFVREAEPSGPGPALPGRPGTVLARRYETAGGVVQAVREQIAVHLRAAVRAEPLAPRTGPVAVQGPMVQVSDVSAFAGAVAQDGGLPFLALGPMDGGRVRALLRETADRLGDRPWGAGIAAGAPPDLRAEQLAAVRDVRPPYAILGAGGPAEAAALEAAGVSAYLHVTSPEPLGRLLGEGARKFVFAGSECGGPAGPYPSFPLWDALVERLAAVGGDARELSVMFAGGVHDARSAAMVAALAGPLAERGADVRVLMGTAYLFTPEAVAAGAIVPAYQDVALSCTGTALLETAPGQAVRCARTPYTETFEQTRRELVQAGTPEREVRRRLEKLNLGRLHLASRGLRLGAPVDPARQRSEGLYAMGQVAALRSATTGIAALHEQVTSGATAFLAARAAELGIGTGEAARDAARPVDVAIIGMGCVASGASDTAGHWADIVGGRAGGEPVPSVPFDADAYGIPADAIGGIDPIQLLSLETASRALQDSGYGDRPFDRSLTSVFFAAEGGGDLGTAHALRAMLPAYLGELPPGLDEQLPRPAGDSLDGARTGAVAARIADGLALGGTACTVGGTQLAALDAACKDLVTGSSAMVLCGGAYLREYGHDQLPPASGEGVVCVVLKRLADAERDGDRIYAVVKSVAGSGGRLALERAHERAGVSPSSVGLAGTDGLTGLITTACALHTGVLPATPGSGGARPWAVRPGERFAGVSGPGFCGRRFHAVLSGYAGAPEPVSGLAEWPAELFVIRADDRDAARAAIYRLARLLDGRPRLRDLARTAASLEGPVQVAFTASGLDDLREKLALAARSRPAPGVFVAAGEPGQVAFLFPDEPPSEGGPSGTLADLFVAFPRLQRLLRLAGGRCEGAGIAGLAVHRLLTAVGVHPDLAAGHGHGELAALCAAGVIDDTDMVEIGAACAVPSRADLLGHDLRSPAFPVWASTTARPYETDPADLAAAPAAPVDAAEQIEAMYGAGARTFVEAGPGRALTDLVGATLGDRPHTAVACAAPGENGLVALLRALAALAAAGVPVDPVPLFAGRGARPLTGPPAEPGWLVDGRSVRTAGGDYPAGALRPPERVAAVRRPADAAVLEYLRTSREIIAAQREVVLRHLTAPVPQAHQDQPAVLGTVPPAGISPESSVEPAAEFSVEPPTGPPAAVSAGMSEGLPVEVRAESAARPGEVSAGSSVEPAAGISAGVASVELAAEVCAEPPTCQVGEISIGSSAEPSAEVSAESSMEPAIGGFPGLPAEPPTMLPTEPAEPPSETSAGSSAEPTVKVSVESSVGPPVEVRAESAARPGEVSAGSSGEPAVGGSAGPSAEPPAMLPTEPAEPVGEVSAGSSAESAVGISAGASMGLAAEVGEPPAGPAGEVSVGTSAVGGSAGSSAESPVEVCAEASGESAGDVSAQVSGELATGVSAEPAASGEASGAGVPRPARPSAHVRTTALSGGPASAARDEPPTAATAVVEEERREGHPAPAQDAGPVPRMRRADRQVWPRLEVRAAGRTVRRIPRIVDLAPLPAPPESGTAFAGRSFVLVDDGCGIALELGDLLERHGAQVRTPLDVDGPCDGLVHLAALRPGAASVLPWAFAGIGRALTGGGLRWLVLASGAGGRFGDGFHGGGIGDPAPGAGLRGLARTIANEYPEVLVRALDLDTKDTPRAIARRIMAELLTADAPVVVGHEGRLRNGLELLPAEPLGDGAPDLGRDAVVLLTGGEHEVTARTALELARTTGCHIELMARAPERDLRLEALEEHAASVRFHAGDARDPQAVRSVAENVHMTHRRLDGVIHGAALGETPRDLDRAYRAKVDGAAALAQAVPSDLRFFVVLCGLAGVRGDRGLAGAAAAEDACGTLVHLWRRRLRGRVLVAGLGPWPDGGPDAGAGLIDPGAAAAALLREIARGDEAHVALTGEVR